MTIDKDKFIEDKNKGIWDAFTSYLIPKGHFWRTHFIEDSYVFTFYRGCLKYFGFLEWKIRDILGGIFLENDSLLNRYSKEYGFPARLGLNFFRNLVRDDSVFSYEFLKELVEGHAEGVSVERYKRRMNCTDPCNSSLGVEGGQFVYYVTVRGGGEQLKYEINRLRPAFVEIFYKSV